MCNISMPTFVKHVCRLYTKGLLSDSKNDYKTNSFFSIMEDEETTPDIIPRSITPPLDDSSDEEARVTPIEEMQEAPHLQDIFRHYRVVASRRRRYTGFISARMGGRQIFIDNDLVEERSRELEDRLFEADTALAVRLSMRTYKPATVTVNKTLIDKKCPVIKARHQKEKCTVCQEHVKRGEDIRILPCHHYLHDECMVGWFTTGNAICPVCRDKSFSSKKRKRAKI